MNFGMQYRQLMKQIKLHQAAKKKYTITYFQVSLYVESANIKWVVKVERAETEIYIIIIYV